MLLGDVYLLHGHTWPGKEFLESRYVIIVHTHPQIEIKNRFGYLYVDDVWVVARLSEIIAKRYKIKRSKLPELIVMPKFNRLSGGIVLNKPELDLDNMHEHGKAAPLFKYSLMKEANIYLLDGSYLGKLKTL